jgi:hypothetical protein
MKMASALGNSSCISILIFLKDSVRADIKEQREDASAEINFTKGLAKGRTGLIFVFIGAMMITALAYRPQERVVEVQPGLAVGLCDVRRLLIKRADGQPTLSASKFLEALNSLDESGEIDSRTQKILALTLANDGALRTAVRDEILRTFLDSSDISVWCEVDRGELRLGELAPSQRRSFNIVEKYRGDGK